MQQTTHLLRSKQTTTICDHSLVVDLLNEGVNENGRQRSFRKKALEYFKNIANALSVTNREVYHGEKGALRLAREVGWCLKDFPKEIAIKAIYNSYNYVCVIGYSLKPPIDKKVWDQEVKNKWLNN